MCNLDPWKHLEKQIAALDLSTWFEDSGAGVFECEFKLVEKTSLLEVKNKISREEPIFPRKAVAQSCSKKRHTVSLKEMPTSQRPMEGDVGK